MRYLWLNLSKDSNNPTYKEIKNSTFNGVLVRDGYARAIYYNTDDKYKSIFNDIEEYAKNKKLGLWKNRDIL